MGKIVKHPKYIGFAPTDGELLPPLSEVMICATICTHASEVLPSFELLPDDFQDPQLRQIIAIVIDMANAGHHVDPITIIDRFEVGSNARMSVIKAMASVDDWFGKTANWREYQAVIMKQSIARKLKVAGQKLSAGHESAADEIEALRARLATSGPELNRSVNASQLSRDVMAWIDAQQAGRGNQIPTGLAEYDRYTYGLHPTDLIVIAGRPSKGKTAFGLTVAANACEWLKGKTFADGQSGVVGFISSEQCAVQLGLRIASRYSRINLGRFRQPGAMRDDDWPRLTSAAGMIKTLPLRIDDTPYPSIDRIRRQAYRWQSGDKLRLLVVDYLQRIQPRDAKAHISERIGEIARDLKNIARELSIPVLVLAQLSRTADERDKPVMADLSGSAEIEKEADVIGLLYKPTWTAEGELALAIEKHRHGESHVDLQMKFDKEHTTWVS